MATIPASENEFPEVLFAEGAAPATPGTGLVKAYAKSDGLLYSKDDAGAETALGAAAHIADTTDAHDGSAVSVDPTGLSVVTGTDVQTAIEELDAGIGAGGIPSTIVDAKGDLIAATAADTVARLAVGTNAHLLMADSGQTEGVKWGTLASASYKRTSGDYTTSSGTFVDVDGTNLALTITTMARRVRIDVTMTYQHSTNATTFFDITIDGTREGGSNGIVAITEANSGGNAHNGSFSYVTDVLSAASHTFKLQWRTSAATATIRGGTSSLYVMKMAVTELGSA